MARLLKAAGFPSHKAMQLAEHTGNILLLISPSCVKGVEVEPTVCCMDTRREFLAEPQ